MKRTTGTHLFHIHAISITRNKTDYDYSLSLDPKGGIGLNLWAHKNDLSINDLKSVEGNPKGPRERVEYFSLSK